MLSRFTCAESVAVLSDAIVAKVRELGCAAL